MKLVEIKNSLAKLYYEPADFKLVLSDFLTIDDGNQKVLSQVVSIETTSKDTTNCAVLKFSLDLNDDGTFSSYSGYVPTLDALVSLTPQKVLQDIFSDTDDAVTIGRLTNSSALLINLKSSLLENFLYIQSDKHESKKDITSKILSFNAEKGTKTIYADFEGLGDFEEYPALTLGKDFKLPIDSEVLNYIYENDLTGLTVEQKTIVQDIIIEIQEYIDTLEDGYIPFDTLLNVVNEIYDTDKSVGIILFRNKLLKYKQSDIFASSTEEICSIDKALSENPVVVADFSKADKNWQNEALSFMLNFIQEKYHLVFEAFDDVITKSHLNEMYKNKNITPVVLSKYDINSASDIKSFAKNLILYKPSSQQRAFATYNSFLNKLSEKEFIVSGECTYYTPLIIKELTDKISYVQYTAEQKEEESINLQIQEIQAPIEETPVIVEPIDQEIAEDIEQNIELTEDENYDNINDEFDIEDDNLLAEDDLQALIENEQISEETENEILSESDISNILEESIEETIEDSEYNTEETENVEQEIAKDVDEMFYVQKEELQTQEETPQEENLVNIDVELINTIEADEDLVTDDLFDDSQADYSMIEDVDMTPPPPPNDSLEDEDLDFIDSLDDNIEFSDTELEQEETPQRGNAYVDIEPLDDYKAFEEPQQNIAKEQNKPELSNIPVYKTELDNDNVNNKEIKIAEGNIVYHEKYGRGIVEQFMNYGNKTFCSILFDNVGRRLMDPKLAELKQM